MKGVKKVLKYLVILLVVLSIISFFLPSTSHIQRSKMIHADAAQLFHKVSDFSSWGEWTTWAKKDSTMKVTMGPITSGEGASYSWTSTANGAGNLTLKNAYPNDSIITTLVFDDYGASKGMWTFVPSGDSTKVTWSNHSELGYNPLSRWMAFLFFDKWMGPDFEGGLNGLDSVIKLTPALPAYNVDISIEEVPSFYYLAMEDSCAFIPDSIGMKFGMIYGAISAHIQSKAIPAAGMPFSMSDEPEAGATTYYFTAGIPIPEAIEAPEGMISGASYTGKAVKAIHRGDYENLHASYVEIMRYMSDNGLESNGKSWEEYVDDPTLVAPEEVRTFIYFPVK